MTQPDTLHSRIHRALSAWHRQETTTQDTLAELVLYTSAATHVTALDLPDARLRSNIVLEDGLTAMDGNFPELATLLRMRFQDRLSRHRCGLKLGLSVDGISKLQSRAIAQLAATIWEMELEARQRRAEELAANLPPLPTGKRFGMEQLEADLVDLLADPSGPGQIVLTGIGGIGKTSLANAAARRLAGTLRLSGIAFAFIPYEAQVDLSPTERRDFCLRQIATQLLPVASALAPAQLRQALRQHCRDNTHLIIIDNLEQPETVTGLVTDLAELAHPGRLLYTSRALPSPTTGVALMAVESLKKKPALALFHAHAARRSVTPFTGLTAAEAETIFVHTGGNPLALKLLAGLLHRLAPDDILALLKTGHETSIEQMYRRIYRSVWSLLDADAQLLLNMMPLVGRSGGSLDQLRGVTGLDDDVLHHALETLHQHSLLEVRGTLRERLYGIHRLTETFLKTDILGWDPPPLASNL